VITGNIEADRSSARFDRDQWRRETGTYLTAPQPKSGPTMSDPTKLRELAAWYREFAERTGNPMIWECRLHTAEDLEAEAARLERLAGGVRELASPSTGH
jgi:hypothetical protein